MVIIKRLSVLVFSTLFSFQLAADTIKDFELPLFGKDGKVKLSELNKKSKIVLNFWASWCTACIQELDELNALKKKYPQFKFIAINAGEKKKKVKRFLKKYNFDYQILVDKNKKYSKSIGVRDLPKTIVVGNKLEVLYRSETPPKSL